MLGRVKLAKYISIFLGYSKLDAEVTTEEIMRDIDRNGLVSFLGSYTIGVNAQTYNSVRTIIKDVLVEIAAKQYDNENELHTTYRKEQRTD